MERIDVDTVLAWRGRTVRDCDGEKIGSVGDVFLDSQTDAPAWATVRTGLFGRHESFVPLAAVTDAGEDLAVPYTQAQVREAPRAEPDVSLEPDEERRLYEHYGESWGEVPRPTQPGEMVRSEEEVSVHPGEFQAAERVRLKKVLVTRHEERTVPVRKEVVQLETEPPPPGAVDEGRDAGEAP